MSHASKIERPEPRFTAGYIAPFLAGAGIFYAVVQASMFAFSLLIVLGVSAIVAWITGRYETRVPHTNLRLKPKDLIAFWGVIWLGLPGGIILSMVASLTAERSKDASPFDRLFRVSVDVVSCVASGLVFLFLVDLLNSAGLAGGAVFLFLNNDVLVAAGAMGIAHFAVRYGIYRISGQEEADIEDERPFAASALSVAASYSMHLFATLILYIVFSHFGVEIGLIILPSVVAGHLAYKIHNTRLEAKTRQITEASRLHLATVEALATAIDARDQVGLGHVRRTQIYAIGIGKALGLNEDQLNALRTGALLHDIGKLAVPDHILNKPGRLTAAEMEKTKIHAAVGSSILENVGFPYPVVPTVRYHHECWDGTGYPEALRGEQIPLTARILAVADVYDTLRGERPYRKAVASDEAISVIRGSSGTRFDPRVVNTLLEHLPRFHAEIESEGLAYEVTTDKAAFAGGPQAVSSTPDFVQQIKRANREVFALYSLAKEFGSAADLPGALSLLTDKIGELAPFDTAVVYLVDPKDGNAKSRHVAGFNRQELMNKVVRVGDGATGYALETRRPVQNVDPALDFAFSEYESSREFTAMVSLPLISNDTLVGAVSLYSRSLACYDDEHVRLLESVARMAADSIVRAQQLAQAESHALTDPMTGLPNSRGLQMHFEKESKRSNRSGSTFQVLVLDLDGFKAVNDTHGHKVGDIMLREIARIMQAELREYDFLARYGGDEFVAIIPDTETIDVLELSRRIEKAVSSYRLEVSAGTSIGVGVSVGSASYPAQGETFDQIVTAADKAMYMTKAIHRQRRRASASESALHSKDARILENSLELPIPADLPPPPEVLPTDLGNGIVLELDDRHIISTTTVN